MPEPELARLYDSLRRLRLTKLLERVDTLLQEASQQDLTYAAFLDHCLAEEVASKTDRQVAMHPPWPAFPTSRRWKALTSVSSRPSTARRSRSWPPGASSSTPRTSSSSARPGPGRPIW